MGAIATDTVALCSSVLYLISLCVVAVLCLVTGRRCGADIKAEIKTPFVTLKLRVRMHDHQGQRSEQSDCDALAKRRDSGTDS